MWFYVLLFWILRPERGRGKVYKSEDINKDALASPSISLKICYIIIFSSILKKSRAPLGRKWGGDLPLRQSVAFPSCVAEICFLLCNRPHSCTFKFNQNFRLPTRNQTRKIAFLCAKKIKTVVGHSATE